MSSCPSERTGLLLVGPYNDFLSEGGKLHERAKPVAEPVQDAMRVAHEINGPACARTRSSRRTN